MDQQTHNWVDDYLNTFFFLKQFFLFMNCLFSRKTKSCSCLLKKKKKNNAALVIKGFDTLAMNIFIFFMIILNTLELYISH